MSGYCQFCEQKSKHDGSERLISCFRSLLRTVRLKVRKPLDNNWSWPGKDPRVVEYGDEHGVRGCWPDLSAPNMEPLDFPFRQKSYWLLKHVCPTHFLKYSAASRILLGFPFYALKSRQCLNTSAHLFAVFQTDGRIDKTNVSILFELVPSDHFVCKTHNPEKKMFNVLKPSLSCDEHKILTKFKTGLLISDKSLVGGNITLAAHNREDWRGWHKIKHWTERIGLWVRFLLGLNVVRTVNAI